MVAIHGSARMFALSSRLDGWRAIWPLFVKVLFTLLYINSSNLIDNGHNIEFFDCKVSSQQHFGVRETEKTHIVADPCCYSIPHFIPNS